MVISKTDLKIGVMTKNTIESIQNPLKTKTLLISHFAFYKILPSIWSYHWFEIIAFNIL